jgi:sirohydrochlorin ferrochelatase
MTGFVVFGHGSRVESANQAVRDIAGRLAYRGGMAVEAAFLELGEPNLAEAVNALVSRGASRVIVIPYFLTLGTHLQRDLPNLIDESALQHPAIAIEMTPPLDGHPALLEALLDRAVSSQ